MRSNETVLRAHYMLEGKISQRTLATARTLSRRHLPSAPAALEAGILAGAIALVLLQFFAVAVYDESPWRLLRMIAALIRGLGALEPDDEFDAGIVVIGVVLHFAFALLYAFALSCLVADTPRRYASIVGLAFGIALYFANFYGFTALFPWFSTYRSIDTLIVHALFGVAVAELYWVFRRSPIR